MASFKKVQEMLCLCLREEIIEVFGLLYEVCGPSNLPFPHSAYKKFSLANKDPAECKADFRVKKRDIPLVLNALRVRMASWSYVQNTAELKEDIKTHKV